MYHFIRIIFHFAHYIQLRLEGKLARDERFLETENRVFVHFALGPDPRILVLAKTIQGLQGLHGL